MLPSIDAKKIALLAAGSILSNYIIENSTLIPPRALREAKKYKESIKNLQKDRSIEAEIKAMEVLPVLCNEISDQGIFKKKVTWNGKSIPTICMNFRLYTILALADMFPEMYPPPNHMSYDDFHTLIIRNRHEILKKAGIKYINYIESEEN